MTLSRHATTRPQPLRGGSERSERTYPLYGQSRPPPPGAVSEQNNWSLMKLHEDRSSLTPWEAEFSQSIASQLKERGTLSKMQRDKALQVLGKRMKELRPRWDE